MLPVDISEINAALALAYKIYNIGWNNIHDAREFASQSSEATSAETNRPPPQ